MKITEEHIMQFGLFYSLCKSTWRTKAPDACSDGVEPQVIGGKRIYSTSSCSRQDTSREIMESKYHLYAGCCLGLTLASSVASFAALPCSSIAFNLFSRAL